jgi:ubiquinone/menaquinone biosynthesis C-methylase UbiE
MKHYFQYSQVQDYVAGCPTIPDHARSILDLGCGAGRTWTDCHFASNGFACGIDCDLTSLEMAKSRVAQVRTVCGLGEQLPFRNQCFDFVFSQVALPYINIVAALAEIHRVLKPDGSLWASLHPASMVWEHLLASSRSFNLKDMVYRPYVILNGFLFHTFGRLIRFPLNRRRCESFQTNRGIERALRATGFREIKILRSGVFVATARRGP